MNCKFKFFSDTFIFYTENDSKDSFRGISAASELFFQEMFLKEIPMRGCLNVGQFYADEENGIFFGRALIDAYKLSEGQNWIGFVLSEEARQKLKDYESMGFKSNKYFSFQEYNVPYKEETKRRNLLVYKPYSDSLNYPERLWMALSNMEHEAFLTLPNEKGNENINTCSKCKRIFTKYHSTQFSCH